MSSIDELPIGTVTFLFTDIEGSTQLLKQLGSERSPGQVNLAEFCDHSIDAQMTRAAAAQVQDPAATTTLWQEVERALLAQAPIVQPAQRRLRLEAPRQLPVQPAVGCLARPALGQVGPELKPARAG